MPTSTNAIYQAAAQLWKPWLEPEALVTLSEGDVLVNQLVSGYFCYRYTVHANAI